MRRRSSFVVYTLLVAAAGFAIWSGGTTLQRFSGVEATGRAVLQTQSALSELHAFHAAAAEMESGARGYALTGNALFLQTFERGRKDAPAALDKLRDRLRDQPAQLARLEQLVPLLAEKMLMAEHGIEYKRAAPEVPFTPRFGQRGRESMDAIRRILDEIETDAREEMIRRGGEWAVELSAAREAAVMAMAAALAALVASGFTVAWVQRRSRRELASARVTATAALDAAEAELIIPRERTAGAAPAQAPGARGRAHPQVLESIGLPLALAALAARVRTTSRFPVQEQIDLELRSPPESQGLLVFRAAEWALGLLVRHLPSHEINLALAGTPDRMVLRVESPRQDALSLSEPEQREAAALTFAFEAVAGTFQWVSGEGGQCLTVVLPFGPAIPTGDAAPPQPQ